LSDLKPTCGKKPLAAVPARAGLGRKEEPETRELFVLACDELGLAPTLPADPAGQGYLASNFVDRFPT